MATYKTTFDFEIVGSLGRQLSQHINLFKGLNREAAELRKLVGGQHFGTLRIPGLHQATKDLSTLHKTIQGLRGNSLDKVASSFGRGFERRVDVLTRHVESRVATMEKALARLDAGGARSSRSIPTYERTAPHRSSRHSGGHGVGTHDARAVIGTYNAAGMPSGSIHYAMEALKNAGTLDQIAQIQMVQGGLDKQLKALSQPALAKQVALNKEAAIGLALKAPYSNAVENMKIITDLADLGKGDYGEARALLPGFARLNALTNVIGSEEVRAKMHEDGQMRYAARALDQMGVMGRSAAEQQKYFDALAMGSVGTRGIFNGRQLFGAVQKSGGAATGWSADFVGGVLPMMVEQMGGTAAGDALYMFGKHLNKGQTSNIAEAQAMINLGLQSKDNLINKKDFRAGSIIGAETLKANPFEWFDKYFLPTLAKKGITSHEDIDKAIDSISISKNYAKALHDFNENHDNIKANLTRFGSQGNLDNLINNTMGGQLVSLTESIKTFGTTLADPQVKGAIGALGDLTSAVGRASKALHDSPALAQGSFAGVAAGAGGLAAAGAAGLTIAMVSALSLPALTIGSIAGLTIGTFLFPWAEFYKYMGWKPGIALGGKDVGGKTLNPSDELPGLSTVEQAGKQAGEKVAKGLTGYDFGGVGTKSAKEIGTGFGAFDLHGVGVRAGTTTAKAFEAAPFAQAGEGAALSLLRGFLSIMGKFGEAAGVSGVGFGGAGFGGNGGIINASFSPGGANDNLLRSLGGAKNAFGGVDPMGGVAGLGKGGGAGLAHARGVLSRANPEMVAYIRASAIRNGIDPNIALRIAASEGLGGSIPGVRMTPGDRGTSFGPYQLHYGGRGSLGTEYTRATGHHAGDPKHWQEQIDFALGYAGRNRTWAPWFGRGPAGVGTHEGFGYKGQAAPTAGPPPRQSKRDMRPIELHVDGKKLARIVGPHIADDHRHPGSTGGPDTHGHHHGPSTHLTDVA